MGTHLDRLTETGPTWSHCIIAILDIALPPSQVRPSKPLFLSTLRTIAGTQHQRRQRKSQSLRRTCRSWLACDGLWSSPNTGNTPLNPGRAYRSNLALIDLMALVEYSDKRSFKSRHVTAASHAASFGYLTAPHVMPRICSNRWST